MSSRVPVLILCVICLTSSAYLTAVDWMLDTGKPEDVRRAVQWMPWNADAWRLMPQAEPERAAEHWRHVLRLAPGDTEADIALALDAEMRGQSREAEDLLLDAAKFNKGYLPAWTLANFYLRQQNEKAFWQWARRAASFENDLTALFELCLRLRPDPPWLVHEFALRRGEALRELLTASAEQDLLPAAIPVAAMVAQLKTARAGEQLLWDADDLLKKGNAAAAREYWNLAARQGLLPYPFAAPPALVNGEFDHVSLERGFDWRPGSAETSLTLGHGLHVGLYAKQEDMAVLAAQTLVLQPGCEYVLRYRYHVDMPQSAHPIRWQVGDQISDVMEPGAWREAVWRFTGPAGLAELKLVSHREPGTHRAAGEVEVAWARLMQTR